MTFTEHTHPKYEVGMVTIFPTYSVITYNDDSKFETQESFYEEEEALKKYDEHVVMKVFDHIILNEIKTYSIVRKVNA
jgi:hypothetical protein